MITGIRLTMIEYMYFIDEFRIYFVSLISYLFESDLWRNHFQTSNSAKKLSFSVEGTNPLILGGMSTDRNGSGRSFVSIQKGTAITYNTSARHR